MEQFRRNCRKRGRPLVLYLTAERRHDAAYRETTWKDWHMRKLGLSLTLAISMGAGAGAYSQSAAPTVDPAWKASEVIQFIGLKKGDKVADIVAGAPTAVLFPAVWASRKGFGGDNAAGVTTHPPT